MGYTRDFTDEAKGRLLAIVQEVNQDTGSLTDKLDDTSFSRFISIYTKNIDTYQRDIIDNLNASAEDIEAIFKAVYEVEERYKPLFSEKLTAITELKTAISGLAGLLDSSKGVNFSLTLPPDQFQAALAGNSDTILGLQVASMIVGYDETGNPIYDWEKIKGITDKPVEELAGYEYEVLANLYISMSITDTERFLSLLAEPVNIADSIYAEQDVCNYSLWRYDQNKLGNLQKCVSEINGHSLAVCEKLTSTSNDDLENYREQLELMRQQLNIEVAVAPDSPEYLIDLRDALLDHVGKDSYRTTQKIALLNALGTLVQANEDEMEAPDYFLGNLEGEGPEFSLLENEDQSLTLKYGTDIDTVELGEGYGGYYYSIVSREPCFINIGDTLYNEEAVTTANNTISRFFTSVFGTSGSDSYVYGGAEAVGSYGIGEGIDYLSNYAEGRGAGKILTKFIGFLPLGGDFAALWIETKIEDAENKENLEASKEFMDASMAADIANRFDMRFNFIEQGVQEKTVYSDGMSSPVIREKVVTDAYAYLSLGEYTYATLERFNTGIEKCGIDVTLYGFDAGEISYSDVVDNLQGTLDLTNDLALEENLGKPYVDRIFAESPVE